MANQIALSALLNDSLNKTARLIAPSFPFALLFVLATGAMVWAAGMLPETTAGTSAFFAAVFAALFAHNLFSASMYRAVLEHRGSLIASAWKLTLAWLLMIVVVAIGASMIVLFFALIGASLGVASTEVGEGVADITIEMQANGTFWPLFGLFLLTLCGVFWFAVRIMLFASATTVRNQVHLFRTWYWTKGHVRALAPLMIVMIAIPVLVLMWLAQIAVSSLLGTAETPLELGASTALTSLVLVPSAWLGHGFAAAAFVRLAAPSEDQTTTPD
ncbi:MAG: hypothetical protein AAGJ68_05840 [Pseudomonadota bacterium]